MKYLNQFMNLKYQINKLHKEIDELPPKSAKELHCELWEATEHLNEANFREAEEIRATVAGKLSYLLVNCKPSNY